jgi:HTH-type transcriptional regulator/antitoxin HigA
MLINERQYEVEKRKVAELENARQKALDKQAGGSTDRLHLLQLEEMLAGMRAEMEEFMRLKEGNVSSLEISSMPDMGKVLIKARIAKGWTAADLAGRIKLLDWSEDFNAEQIGQLEATFYQDASLAMLALTFDALELKWVGSRIELVSTAASSVAGH